MGRYSECESYTNKREHILAYKALDDELEADVSAADEAVSAATAAHSEAKNKAHTKRDAFVKKGLCVPGVNAIIALMKDKNPKAALDKWYAMIASAEVLDVEKVLQDRIEQIEMFDNKEEMRRNVVHAAA